MAADPHPAEVSRLQRLHAKLVLYTEVTDRAAVVTGYRFHAGATKAYASAADLVAEELTDAGSVTGEILDRYAHWGHRPDPAQPCLAELVQWAGDAVTDIRRPAVERLHHGELAAVVLDGDEASADRHHGSDEVHGPGAPETGSVPPAGIGRDPQNT